MSGQDHQTSTSVARLEVHAHYHGQSLRDLSDRQALLEADTRRMLPLIADVSELRERLRLVEAAVQLGKVAAGLGMLTLAGSGSVSGAGEKVLRTLLGMP